MEAWDIFFTMELFFAALLIGFTVSLTISYFFSLFSLKLDYDLEYAWAKKEQNREEQERLTYKKNKIALPFWGYLVIIVLFFGILLYSFNVFADITNKVKNESNTNENVSCTCSNTTTINNYNLTVNQIAIKNQHQELSIKELQYLINSIHKN